MKKKKKDVMTEKPQLDDDLEAFEEWENKEGGKGKEEESAPEGQVVHEDEGLDLDVFEEPGAEKKSADVGSQGSEAGTDDLGADFADLAPDVPVNLVAVIGKTTTNVGELIKYRIGSVIDLGRTPGETVDLVANGRLIGRGELVEMEGKLGVRILKLVR